MNFICSLFHYLNICFRLTRQSTPPVWFCFLGERYKIITKLLDIIFETTQLSNELINIYEKISFGTAPEK